MLACSVLAFATALSIASDEPVKSRTFLFEDSATDDPKGSGSADNAKKEREIAGRSEFLRLLPKPFATLKAVDPKERTVTLLIDGEKEAKTWPVEPDAELKVGGWWGTAGAIPRRRSCLGLAKTRSQEAARLRHHARRRVDRVRHARQLAQAARGQAQVQR